MSISFWFNDPTILFNKNYILELCPVDTMSYEQKLNAISRLIIALTVLGYILTMTPRILVVGGFTLSLIVGLYKMRKQKLTKNMLENFELQQAKINEPQILVNPVTLESMLKTEFKEGTKKNPFSNVLLTQINDEPERKAAPPSFNAEVDADITKNIKRTVQMLNPGIKNTNKQLFGDLSQKFELDQSSRSFFSTANTRVTNDQGAFAKFLYGNLPSSKESGPESAMMRIKDSYRHVMN
jgi:hypothetical protein